MSNDCPNGHSLAVGVPVGFATALYGVDRAVGYRNKRIAAAQERAAAAGTPGAVGHAGVEPHAVGDATVGGARTLATTPTQTTRGWGSTLTSIGRKIRPWRRDLPEDDAESQPMLSRGSSTAGGVDLAKREIPS